MARHLEIVFRRVENRQAEQVAFFLRVVEPDFFVLTPLCHHLECLVAEIVKCLSAFSFQLFVGQYRIHPITVVVLGVVGEPMGSTFAVRIFRCLLFETVFQIKRLA